METNLEKYYKKFVLNLDSNMNWMCRFSSFVGMLVMLRHPEIEDLGKNVSNFFLFWKTVFVNLFPHIRGGWARNRNKNLKSSSCVRMNNRFDILSACQGPAPFLWRILYIIMVPGARSKVTAVVVSFCHGTSYIF